MSLFDFLKHKPHKNELQRKKVEYKTFPLQNYSQQFFFESGVEDEGYDMSKKEILENSLEDEKIYRYQFDHLLPSITDNGNGYDVLVSEQKIAVIEPSIADDLDYFLDNHKDYELLLDISGGPFKVYDSDSGKISTGRDKYTAKLCVKYFVNVLNNN